MVTLILFVLIFGVVVISHEFGHFLLAKANGIHVIEFSVGMGPNLFSFQKGDTKYSLKLLPIGGACMFEGEDGLNEKEDGEDHSGSFLNANVWARISTVLAGPIFNFILGFIIAFIMVNLIVIRDPVATEIVDGGAAQEAGLEAGDSVAVFSRFSGTFRNLRIGCKNTSPPIVSTTAANRPSTRELPKDLRNLSISFAPKHCAEIIAKPLHIPIRNCTIRLLSVVVAPTAARALSPRKVPTMRVSARL